MSELPWVWQATLRTSLVLFTREGVEEEEEEGQASGKAVEVLFEVVPNAAGPTFAALSRASNVITQVATIMKPAMVLTGYKLSCQITRNFDALPPNSAQLSRDY